MKSRRKRSSSRVRNKEKVSKGEHEGMALRSIGNNKKEKGKEKKKTTDDNNKGLISNSNIIIQPGEEEPKTTIRNTTTATTIATTTTTPIPEAFDSSKYNAMTEMKESANIKERDLNEVLSNVEGEEPPKPEAVNINSDDLSTSIQANAQELPSITATSVNPPSLEERASVVRGSKKEEEEEKTTTIPSSSQLQRQQQQETINKSFDETKDDTKKTTNEARKEIPQYIQSVGDLQERTIQNTMEIADNYIGSQKEIINSFQSVWIHFAENLYSGLWNYWWWISQKGVAETYKTIASTFADNMLTAMRLTNNTIFANMELFSTAMQQTKDNSKELSKIAISAAKVFHETSKI